MPAAVIGGVIAGVGAIGAAAISSSATKKASKTAAAAQEKATDSQLQIAQGQQDLYREVYAQNKETLNPYVQSGYGAQAVVEQLLGLKPLTASQFNNGDWYTPGTVDYNKGGARTAPATPAPTTPTPTTPATPTPTGTPAGSFAHNNDNDLAQQAQDAIAAGANPALVRARMAGMGVNF